MKSNIFFSIKKCPICKTKEYSIHKIGYKNRYSELLSEKLKMSENSLLKYCFNVKCKNCGLVYKKNWFKENILRQLFTKDIPVHPKGWDKFSNKFSENYLKHQINKLKMTKPNDKKFDYLKRDILSIINSIELKNLSYKNIEFIKKINFNLKYNYENIKLINLSEVSKLNFTSKEYSRFKGLGSKDLINYLNKISPNFNSYLETGCPLWGNIDLINANNKKLYFGKLKNCEFWGKNCKIKNIYCQNKIKNNCTIINFDSFDIKKKIDISCNFLMLDHTINPLKIFKHFFKISNINVFILEDVKEGVPIQHFTGWSNFVMRFVAKKFNKNIKYGFNSFSKSNLKLFCIY
jgi:hypothetical protein